MASAKNQFLPQSARHFINGDFVDSISRRTFETSNPATGAFLCEVARGEQIDVNAAVNAASKALSNEGWRDLSREERAAVLMRIAATLEKHASAMAQLESLDTGKPIGETSQGDIPRAVANFRFFADLLLREPAYSEFIGADGSRHRAARRPAGVCGLITPWNLPLYLETWKLAPALAMGNTVVLKPAELTPLSAHALCEILQECALPPGVVNVVQGFGEAEAGEALVRHPHVRCISFTGETSTGKAIMRTAAETIKKLSFELGGKGASVVFADANLETAAATAVRAAFRNQGQVCLAGSRLLVEASIFEEFVEKILKHVRAINVGDPLQMSTNMGSLISQPHRDRVANFVRLAKEEGAEILAGGFIPDHLPASGAYYAPTVISGLTQKSRLIQEEIFGPVLTIQTFQDLEEATTMLNDTKYGLSCSVWSESPNVQQKFSEKAQCGLVWINAWFLRHLETPFGGMKQSGLGREGGRHSFDFYSEWQTVSTPQ